jgi:hypothetical protein
VTPLEVKAAVRERDGYCCTECGMTHAQHRARYRKTLDVHRLTPGGEYTLAGCVTLCRKCHGSKPRSPRGSSPFLCVKINGDLYHKMKLICAFTGERLNKYLDRILSEAVEQEYREAVRRMAAEIGLIPTPPESRP